MLFMFLLLAWSNLEYKDANNEFMEVNKRLLEARMNLRQPLIGRLSECETNTMHGGDDWAKKPRMRKIDELNARIIELKIWIAEIESEGR